MVWIVLKTYNLKAKRPKTLFDVFAPIYQAHVALTHIRIVHSKGGGEHVRGVTSVSLCWLLATLPFTVPCRR